MSEVNWTQVRCAVEGIAAIDYPHHDGPSARDVLVRLLTWATRGGMP